MNNHFPFGPDDVIKNHDFLCMNTHRVPRFLNAAASLRARAYFPVPLPLMARVCMFPMKSKLMLFGHQCNPIDAFKVSDKNRVTRRAGCVCSNRAATAPFFPLETASHRPDHCTPCFSFQGRNCVPMNTRPVLYGNQATTGRCFFGSPSDSKVAEAWRRAGSRCLKNLGAADGDAKLASN